MKAVAATCWTVKVASASMARISSGDCCGGATGFKVSALHAVIPCPETSQSGIARDCQDWFGSGGRVRTSSKHGDGFCVVV